MFELLAACPDAARAFKQLADKNGVHINVELYTGLADAYKKAGEPIPPDLRDYLLQQAKTMTPKQREKYLKPYVS
jgi:hypothetical protein